MMTLRPDMVEMDRLPRDTAVWPIGIGGKNPHIFASADVGMQALDLQKTRMSEILRRALA